MERLLTVDDVARTLSISRRTAYTYMAKMDHLMRPLRVTEGSLRAWIAQGTERPGSKPVRSIKHRKTDGYLIPKRRS